MNSIILVVSGRLILYDYLYEIFWLKIDIIRLKILSQKNNRLKILLSFINHNACFLVELSWKCSSLHTECMIGI